MFVKPAPKGWFEVEVRPSYNNPRKLKKTLDDWFKPNEYKVQAYRDRWIIMTSRQLTPAQINDINKPRDEAIAAKAKPSPQVTRFRTMFDAMIKFKYGPNKKKDLVEDTGRKREADSKASTSDARQ